MPSTSWCEMLLSWHSTAAIFWNRVIEWLRVHLSPRPGCSLFVDYCILQIIKRLWRERGPLKKEAVWIQQVKEEEYSHDMNIIYAWGTRYKWWCSARSFHSSILQHSGASDAVRAVYQIDTWPLTKMKPTLNASSSMLSVRHDREYRAGWNSVSNLKFIQILEIRVRTLSNAKFSRKNRF